MGNAASGGISESEDDENEFFEELQDATHTSEHGTEEALDVGVLFDHSLLRETASKIKEEAKETFLQQHLNTAVRWLEERKSRHEEVISLSQFVDMLVSKGARKDDCVELFNQFDVEGDGYADVETFLEALQSLLGGRMSSNGELKASIKALQACSITPGFVDAFVNNEEAVTNHGQKLLKFLVRNRAPSTSLPLPALEGFCNTSDMRLKVVQAHMAAVKAKEEMRKKAPSVEEGEVLKPLTKCYNSIEVSSNKLDVTRLTNGDPSTYWQSDGPARSHWLRLRMRPNVVLKQLSINVASSDQSYMPHHVIVSAGRDENNLREISDVRIPSHFTGDYVLVENVKIPYPVVQINARRCHSDGCDTRIRGLKAVGYRVVKSQGMSVGDASAVWYLAVLGATATAAMPTAPHLRSLLLSHTRTALSHMKPLCLSSTCPDRPAFLTQHVLEEIENLLLSVVRHGGQLQPDSLSVLLEFTLARGNMKSIFRVFKLLLEIADENFQVTDILKSLEDVQVKAIGNHGSQIKLSLVSSDGGEKDSSSKPINVLTDNWLTEAYLSESGRTRVTMLFSAAASAPVMLTKTIIKVSRGAIGPSHGLVFVLDDFSRDEKDKVIKEDLLNQYNDWTKASYLDYLKRTRTSGQESDGPVAFFATEEDWDEIEVVMDRFACGKYVLIKFLGARKETAERIGVLGIHFFGYEIKPKCPLTADLHLDEAAPVRSGAPVEGTTLLIRILSFLDEMTKDQALMRCKPKTAGVSREKEGQLVMTGIRLDDIWDVYSVTTSRGVQQRQMVVSIVLLLRLLYRALPYLRRDSAANKDEDSRNKHHQLSSSIFSHLCQVVDDGKGIYANEIQGMAKLIILDGAEVFFPETSMRRERLLSMVDVVMGQGTPTSLGLTFESLCRFFSSKDASGLLGLPDVVTEAGFDHTPVVSVMSTLLSVAYQECVSCLSNAEEKACQAPSNLVQLLCAMQTSLLLWCSSQLKADSGAGRATATSLVIEYSGILAEKVNISLQTVQERPDKLALIGKLEHTYVSAAIRQLVLFLHMFTDVEAVYLPVLRCLQPIAVLLKRFSSELPELFFEIDSEEWNKGQGQAVLRTWEVESPHNYENNQDVSMAFSCPGCCEFSVEFDQRCETERRYDFLEFTDSNGNKRRFDQKVGTDEWPKVVSFKAGNRLLFTFHSDGSNNEWGYKFTVTAIGSPDVALSWVFDLQLGMARLFGLLCSTALDCRKCAAREAKDAEESKLLRSEIWTTLFRGGYMTGKLQRSLSGHHATTSHPLENSVQDFLHSLVYRDDGRAKDLIQMCREKFTGPFMGGADVDRAVNAAFAALIWHSQELRDQVYLFASHTPPETVPEGILEAYTTAESLRRSLVDRRQKLILLAEEEAQQGGDTVKSVKPEVPVIACREKAEFLLKFAGLQRMTDKAEAKENRRSKWLARKPSWHRALGEHSNSAHGGNDEEMKAIDKHPAFQLILDFVTNEAYSHNRIHGLLQQRVKHANTVADVYLFAAEYLRMSSTSDLVQAPAVLFLQQFLASQKYFPRHYADNLDGCGLSLESKVRQAYYTLVRRALEGVKSYQCQSAEPRPTSAAFECLRAFALHLLDTEWKAYDHSFVLDIHLPEFLLDTTRDTAAGFAGDMTECSEQKELDHYEECMKWFEEAQSKPNWWRELIDSSTNDDVTRRMHLFVARFSECLDVEITCDGCSKNSAGRRYRCLTCRDVDICSTCYQGGVIPDGHSEEHEVVDMRFQCDGCRSFIVGTRFHCLECDDFDLCIGCHTFSKFPPHHSSTHKTTKYAIRPDPNMNRSHSLAQVYTHQHSWLQFSALALSLASTLSQPNTSVMNADYLRSAGLLHIDCIDLAIRCLAPVTKPKQDFPTDDKVARRHGVSAAEEGRSQSPDPLSPHESTQQLVVSSQPSGDASKVGKAPEGASKSSGVSNEPALQTESSPRPAADGEVAEKESVTAAGSTDETNEDVTRHETEQPVPMEGEAARIAESPEETKGNSGIPRPVDRECESEDTLAGEKVQRAEVCAADQHRRLNRAVEEGVIGLLGAILPQDSKLAHWTRSHAGIEEFLSRKFLPALFKIIRSDNCEAGTKSLSLGILAKFLQCTSPALSDVGVSLASGEEVTERGSTSDGPAGQKTVKFLFQLGAGYLARSDLDASSGMASTLQQLASCSQWQPSVDEHLGECLHSLAEPTRTVDLSAVFGLLVFAGFPDVFRMGSLVEVDDATGEKRRAVVMKWYSEKGTVIVVDVKSRRKRTVKEDVLESMTSLCDNFESSRSALLLRLVRDALHRLKQGGEIPVERMWVSYLSLKALFGHLKSSDPGGLLPDLFSCGALPLLVNLASRGTAFSCQWLHRDLEVLSLKLYKLNKEEESKTTATKKEKDDVNSTTAGDAAAAGAGGSGISTRHPYHGLDDETRECFKTIHEAVRVPLSILRALYEHVGKDKEKLLEEVQRSYDGSSFRTDDVIKNLAQKWEPSSETAVPNIIVVNENDAVDVGVVRCAPKVRADRPTEATPEQDDMGQKIMSNISDGEIAETRTKQARTKSAALLRAELDKDHSSDCAEYLQKVNLALAIMYGRHVLAALLAEWPGDKVLTSDQLDGCDELHVIGLLDLLQRLEDKRLVQQIVANVVACGEAKLIHPLSVAAVHCMAEMTMLFETRESEHKYKNDTKDEGKVHIPGASTLLITFDPKCSTEGGCDELVLSTSQDFQQNRHVFSGSHDQWIDVEFPGDTVYYRFTSDSSNNDWGWKFVASGGQMGRFQTGYLVLDVLFSSDRNIARTLPLKSLWKHLVAVASCQTGQQRLMATGLLLRLLLVVSGQAVHLDGSRSEPLTAPERPELGLLKPLWVLYTEMLDKESAAVSPALVSPVLRGFTELFLVVENLAQDWGMAEDLVVGFTTAENLKRCFSQVVQRVGLIGLAIGVPNKASEALVRAAALGPPPLPPRTYKKGNPKANSPKQSKDEGLIPIVIPLADEDDEDGDEDDTTADEEDLSEGSSSASSYYS